MLRGVFSPPPQWRVFSFHTFLLFVASKKFRNLLIFPDFAKCIRVQMSAEKCADVRTLANAKTKPLSRGNAYDIPVIAAFHDREF